MEQELNQPSGGMNKSDMKRKEYLLLILLAIPLSVIASAQVEDSTLQALTAHLKEYTEKIPWEEVYIHSDREEYISGEDFWFNVYVFDRKSLKLSGDSKIVYLEVLNSANQPIVQNRILVRDGTGPGHFVLPDTLSTGYYTVRAYTNRMKNFLPGNCFMKEIVVFNALKHEDQKPDRHSISARIGGDDKQDAKSVSLSVKSISDSLEIILETDNSLGSESRNVFYLVVQTRGNIDYATRILIKASEARILISREHFAAGINQITIFNASGKPLTEKLTFTPPVSTESYGIQSKNSFTTRDDIELNIIPGIPQDSRFSISAAPLSDTSEGLNIEDYLIFGSEFNSEEGIVSWNSLIGKSMNQADSILSGLSSRWIRWQDIVSGIFPEPRYSLENEYNLLSGNIEDGNMDTVLLCFPGTLPWFQYSIADEKGYFTFKLHIDEQLHDLILMSNGTSDKRISIESSFPSIYMNNNYNSLTREDILPENFSKMGINFQVMKIFGVSVKNDSVAIEYSRKPVSFYGQPQNEIRLSDFVELPTMSEIFLELIPDVSLRQKRSGHEILITRRINDKRFVLYPTLMIDGVVIRNASEIAGISPDLVEKIDVVKNKYLVGDYLFDGIVNVITKAADFSCIPMPANIVRSGYRVAEPVPDFVAPGYSGNAVRNSRIPDYRNTLYWSPSSGENMIEFRSSDNKMKYLINIQGVTGEGKPFSIRKTISVE